MAFNALKSMTNLEDLSLKAENAKDLCDFLNQHLIISFKRLRKLRFNCLSRDELPKVLFREHPNLMDLQVELSSYGQSFKAE